VKARAAVQVADRRIEIQHLDVPDVAPDHLLLRVEGSGICGSDHEQYAGVLRQSTDLEYPLVPGHEPVGRVAEIGPDAARAFGLAVGDRVAVETYVACNVCANCVRGLRKFCAQRFIYGYTPTTVGCGLWGGFGEYLLIRPGSLLHRVPDDLSIEDAVLFNPFGAGFEWAVRRAGTQVGDVVLVLGSGQRGLACVVAAREAGAATVVVTGLASDRAKLDLALDLGADHALVVDGDGRVEGGGPVAAAVADLTHGLLADRVVDTTPIAVGPIADAVEAVRPGGTVVLAGIKGRRALEHVYPDRITTKAIDVRGALSVESWGYQQAIRLVASHRYPLERLHTHTLPIEQAAHGIELLAGEVPGETAIHVTIVP
jgi:threonine dehydrogenase-like Zn-dependent dehydrogenase